MNFKSLLVSLLSLLCIHTHAFPTGGSNITSVSTLFSWPAGSWAENIAVRRNGKLLVTRLDVAQLWQVDPAGTNATLVYDFSPYTSCLGISEVTHDIFAVVVSNFSVTTLSASPGTSSIWTVDVRGYPRRTPTATLVTTVPEAGFLNGLTRLRSSDGTVLAADSGTGDVYSINTYDGGYSVVLHDDDTTTVAPDANPPIGINGIHTRGGYLYYTNSLRFSYNRVKLNRDGTADGPYEVLYSDSGPLYDDFAISRDGNVYIGLTTSIGLRRITPDGTGWTVLSTVNATLGTTAVAFSRDGEQTLYLVTSGGLAQGLAEPARVVAVNGLQ